MINFRNVTKTYKSVNALDHFSLDIKDDGIYCLLGRNGAGKTTLLKSIAGQQPITEGEILIDNRPVQTENMTSPVSYIESFAQHFNWSTTKLIQAASQFDPEFNVPFATEMASRFHLPMDKKFNKLSLGMKTMVSTLISLASNKKVILLDEPVLGFDAIMRIEFYNLLLESYQHNPRILMISTHIIDEISKIAQHLIVIDSGKLKFYEELSVLDEKAYSVTGVREEVEQATHNLHAIGETAVGGFLTRFIFDERILSSDKIKVQSLTLQDFFVGLVGNQQEVQ